MWKKTYSQDEVEAIVRSYSSAKGGVFKEEDSLAVVVEAALLAEYGKLAPIAMGVSKVSLELLPVEKIGYHSQYLQSVEARSPLVEEEGQNIIPIIGVVRRDRKIRGVGGLRLVDGYHRFSWATKEGLLEGLFIVFE